MDYKPHILRPVGGDRRGPPAERPSSADDEIRKRAIADADRSFQNIRDDLRRLVRSVTGQSEE